MPRKKAKKAHDSGTESALAAVQIESDFFINEVVLAFFGKMLYEAKILKFDIRNGEVVYFVHYQKWPKRCEN